MAIARGAEVIALVRTAHLDRVRALGAKKADDYKTIPRGIGEFDVIICTVGKVTTPTSTGGMN